MDERDDGPGYAAKKPLDTSGRVTLAALAADQGLRRTAADLGVSVGLVRRALAGRALTRGSRALLAEGLESLRSVKQDLGREKSGFRGAAVSGFDGIQA